MKMSTDQTAERKDGLGLLTNASADDVAARWRDLDHAPRYTLLCGPAGHQGAHDIVPVGRCEALGECAAVSPGGSISCSPEVTGWPPCRARHVSTCPAQRIYAVPPYTKVVSLDFEDHLFEASKANHPCGLSGGPDSYLDELIFDNDGRLMHGEMRHDNGVIMLGSVDTPPQVQSPGIYVVVADVGAHHKVAVAAGADIVYPPEAICDRQIDVTGFAQGLAA